MGGVVRGMLGRALARRRSLAAAGALVVLSLLVVRHLRKHFPRMDEQLIGGGTDILAQHMFMAWQWFAVEEGRFGEILSLPIFHPFPSGAAFHESLIGLAALGAPVYLATKNTVLAYDVVLVATYVLTSLSLYALGRTMFRSPTAGVVAATIVPFLPPRLQHISTINLVAPFFALFAMALVVRWMRRPTTTSIVAAAVLFAAQLATATQWAILALYLAAPWLIGAWAAARFRVDARRARQLVVAGAVFVALSLPWVLFHDAALDSRHGLLRTQSMEYYRMPYERLAQYALVDSVWFLPAVVGALLVLVLRTGPRAHRALLRGQVVGLVVGLAFLFVVALGAYKRVAGNLETLPGLWAFRHLPLIEGFRVPPRLAMWTPYFLALFAGGAAAVVEHRLRRVGRRSRVAGVASLALPFLPLLLARDWPALPTGTAKPIAARPHDLAFARALDEKLPKDAVLIQLPFDGNLPTFVDERVLVHRRPQVSGQASVIPVLWEGLRYFGQWPASDVRGLRALGATHVVAPKRAVDEPSMKQALDDGGWRLAFESGDKQVYEVPPAPAATAAAADRGVEVVEVAPRAVAGRWTTLSRFVPDVKPSLRGFLTGRAVWTAADGATTDVDVRGIVPGITGLVDPQRFHVPTPEQPGRYALRVDADGFVAERTVEVVAAKSTADAPIVAGTVVGAATGLVRVRARHPYTLPARATAGEGPVWLATSTRDVPDRQGETILVYQYRGATPQQPISAMPFQGLHALHRDLFPGESDDVVLTLVAPPPGTWELWARLEAYEQKGNKMPFAKVADVEAF